MPKTMIEPTARPRHCTSVIGVGHPDCRETATASGKAAFTVAASASEMRGRRRMRDISSSSIIPTWMGVRRTWKVFAPTIASAMFSFT